MSGKTMSTSDTKIEALKLQSSAYGVTIPVVAGVTRIPGNLIYYNDFQAVPKTTSQGGKGGVKTQNTTYSYNASVLMGLCAGQVNAIPRIWVGKQLYSDDSGAVTTTTYSGEPIAVSPGGTATVAHAAGYSAHISLTIPTSGSSGVETGDSWEIQLAEGIDFTVVAGVYTFSPSVPTATGAVTYQATGTGAGSSALQKLGMTLFPGTLSQSPASWVTTRHPSDALSYASLAYVSADGYALGTGAQVENHNFEVVGPGAFALGSAVADVDPTIFSINLMLDGRYGARLPSSMFQSASDWSNYCVANSILMSPALTTQMKAADFLAQMAQLTNTGIVWSDGRVQMIPYGDTSASAFGQTYTPNLTPEYDLSDDVYIVDQGAAPVSVTRKKQSDAYNHVRVQFQNRGNQYAKEIAEAKDQADIETNGLRSMAIITADWICDPGVARIVAQLILQRTLYVRATYEWKLPWNFGFLDPMDLVTLTDPSLGLNKTTVRITDIEEDGEALKFTAESFALGVANSALYGTQVGTGFAQDYNVSPGSASICYIFEAPVPLTTDRLEVMVAATGNLPSWGGCRVWGSLDGTNYKEIGKISGGSRGGTITANMTAGQANMSVNLISGSLTSGSSADATNLTTLSYIGGANPEYVAYQTANLTSAQHYDLSGLVRGAYGSAAAAHTTGDPFVRIDENIARSGPLDKALIGTTVHVKLTSFNIFGFAEESLASVPDHTYTILGTFAAAAAPAVTGLTATGISHGIRLAGTLPANTNTFTLANVEVWEGTTNVLGSATKIDQGLASTYDRLGLTAANGTMYYWVRCVDTYGNFGPFTGPVWAVAGITAVPSTISTLAAASIIGGIRLTCTLPSDPDLAALQLYENTVNNSATATMIASGLTDHYDRIGLLPSNGTRYYWVKCVNTSGTVGAFSNVASAVAGQVATAQIAAAAITNSLLASGAVTFGKMTIAQLSDIANNAGTILSGTYGGTASIHITGTMQADGITSSNGNTWAMVGNESLVAYGGVIGYTSTGRGLYGYATGAGTACAGTSATSGTGIVGVSSSGTGVVAQSTSWNGLQITGKATQDNSTYTWNGYAMAAPGGSTTTCLHNDGVWRDPVTTSRVNAAFGVAATGVCQIIVGNTGTATVSGSGLNLTMGTGLSPTYQVRGTGNNLIMESVSDARLKQDIEPEKLGLDFVLKLAPLARQFRMINDPQQRLQHGWIAQDIEKLVGSDTIDGMVFTNEDGTMGINHILVISILSKAVAELERRIPVPLVERVRRWFTGARTWH
jgi:hypothetical protein